MKDLLLRILNKRGIKSVDELDKAEKETFDNWNKTLSKDELTIQDIKDFCQSQVDIIETKWADYNLEEHKKSDLVPYHTIYRILLKVVDSPKQAREALEKNLIQLLDKK